ncbi:MAG: ABC transporter permease [Chloroflexi bacterium]|nr:ABC transporter permease [Chloroflexota bacterium]
MASVVLSRLVQAVPSVLGVTLIAFVLLQASGDLTTLLLPAEASDEVRAAFRRAYGLDEPIPVQYLHYLSRLAQGDFGRSFAYNRPASQVVLERLPATLELSAVAMAIAVALAIPAGIISAVRRNSLFDRLSMGVVLLGQSVPTFWLGMLLILVFAVQFQVLPVSGRGSLAQLVLPSVTLAMWLLALLARLTRSGMLEVLSQDYIRTARAKGLGELSVTTRHALRNTLIPIVTVIGLQIGSLLGGAVMTETVFAWPGIGTLVLDSILKRDYPVVLAALIMVAAGFVLINLLIDVLYAYLDPRVKRSA